MTLVNSEDSKPYPGIWYQSLNSYVCIYKCRSCHISQYMKFFVTRICLSACVSAIQDLWNHSTHRHENLPISGFEYRESICIISFSAKTSPTWGCGSTAPPPRDGFFFSFECLCLHIYIYRIVMMEKSA